MVVATYERLDESGCLERLGVPAGCILDDTVVRDEVTATFGPDGACWTFVDSGIPRAYRRSERCQDLIAQAPPCSDF